MLTKVKLAIIAILAALAAIVAAFWHGKSKGRAEVKNETLTKQNEVKTTQLDIAAKPNADAATLLERMRQGDL